MRLEERPMFDHDTDETVSRRSVLRTIGGIAAGTTVLTTAGHGSAEAEEGLRMEVRERTAEYLAVEVSFPDDTFSDDEEFPDDTFGEEAFPDDVFLGHADQFVVREGGEWVSLPEETDRLARPVHAERINERGEWPKRYAMYFTAASVDEFPEADGEHRLGLGAFAERTIPGTEWDTAVCPGHRD